MIETYKILAVTVLIGALYFLLRSPYKPPKKEIYPPFPLYQ
jgi:hypothetical protein